MLSVLGVRQRAIPTDTLPFGRLGDPGGLKRGDQVYHVGYANGEPWRVNVTPDRISGTSGDLLKFESSSIAPGNSGGGLFDARWHLEGMVRADQPPDGVAVSIGRIRATLQGWGYPVSLTSAVASSDRPAVAPESKPQRLSYVGFDAIGRYPAIVQVFDPG